MKFVYAVSLVGMTAGNYDKYHKIEVRETFNIVTKT